MEYNTQKELYDALFPVFNIKKRLNSITKYQYITKDDIWHYLIKNKWKNSYNLTISEVVNDIITIDIEEVAIFIQGGQK